MSENQTPAKSTVEGELSLDDLEKIAGGTGSLADNTGSDPFAQRTLNLLPKQDNMFTKDGDKGTTLDATYSNGTALDPNELKFP